LTRALLGLSTRISLISGGTSTTRATVRRTQTVG
jgi:hypothetical protein